MTTKVLLVVPCFNEENRFDINYWKRLASLGEGIEIVFVDDGSTDSTPKILNDFCQNTGTNLIKQEVNLGKSEAVRVGMLQAFLPNADYSHVGFIDADGAFGEQDVKNLIEFALRSNNKAVFSSRVALLGRQIDRNVSRHYIGRILSSVISFGLSDIPYDSQSGFKIFEVDSKLKESLEMPFKTRWFFDLELYFRLFALHGNSEFAWEYPLDSWRDIAGSKIKGYEVFRIALETKKIIQIARRV
jgi:dolichyl-phosphate beta-glucosyltransferase